MIADIRRPQYQHTFMHLDKTLAHWEKGIDIIFRGAPVVIVAHAEKENPRAQTTCTIALTYLEIDSAPIPE